MKYTNTHTHILKERRTISPHSYFSEEGWERDLPVIYNHLKDSNVVRSLSLSLFSLSLSLSINLSCEAIMIRREVYLCNFHRHSANWWALCFFVTMLSRGGDRGQNIDLKSFSRLWEHRCPSTELNPLGAQTNRLISQLTPAQFWIWAIALEWPWRRFLSICVRPFYLGKERALERLSSANTEYAPKYQVSRDDGRTLTEIIHCRFRDAMPSILDRAADTWSV